MKKYLLVFALMLTSVGLVLLAPKIAEARNDNTPVTICHKDGDHWHTITVDDNAVQAHLDHGDYLGACLISSSSSSLQSQSSSKSSESEESSESSSEKSSSSSSKTSDEESSGSVSSGENSSSDSRTSTILGAGTGDGGFD